MTSQLMTWLPLVSRNPFFSQFSSHAKDCSIFYLLCLFPLLFFPVVARVFGNIQLGFWRTQRKMLKIAISRVKFEEKKAKDETYRRKVWHWYFIAYGTVPVTPIILFDPGIFPSSLSPHASSWLLSLRFIIRIIWPCNASHKTVIMTNLRLGCVGQIVLLLLAKETGNKEGAEVREAVPEAT